MIVRRDSLSGGGPALARRAHAARLRGALALEDGWTTTWRDSWTTWPRVPRRAERAPRRARPRDRRRTARRRAPPRLAHRASLFRLARPPVQGWGRSYVWNVARGSARPACHVARRSGGDTPSLRGLIRCGVCDMAATPPPPRLRSSRMPRCLSTALARSRVRVARASRGSGVCCRSAGVFPALCSDAGLFIFPLGGGCNTSKRRYRFR